MKALRWESVATALFFAAMTYIASGVSNDLREMKNSVSELNKTIAVLIVKGEQTAEEAKTQKEVLVEHGKELNEHEKRITVLERGK